MNPEEENKIIARRVLEEGFNEGRLGTIEDLVSGDHVDHTPLPGQSQGVDGTKQFIATFRGAFPDLRLEVVDMVAEGDRVVTRLVGHGTHRGSFLGVSATGRTIELTGMVEQRMDHGQVAESWTNLDTMHLLEQIGAIHPATGETPEETAGFGDPKE